MTNPRTYLLSNLASGVFIDLAVDTEDDVLQAARAHLRQTELPPEVQNGFFVSLYPTDSAANIDGPTTPTTPAAAEPDVGSAKPDASSPLDAAAAQGPMDWTESESPANADEEPDTADTSALSPIVAPPLGSAGGH